jgi:hypothetical protein
MHMELNVLIGSFKWRYMLFQWQIDKALNKLSDEIESFDTMKHKTKLRSNVFRFSRGSLCVGGK